MVAANATGAQNTKQRRGNIGYVVVANATRAQHTKRTRDIGYMVAAHPTTAQNTNYETNICHLRLPIKLFSWQMKISFRLLA